MTVLPFELVSSPAAIGSVLGMAEKCQCWSAAGEASGMVNLGRVFFPCGFTSEFQ